MVDFPSSPTVGDPYTQGGTTWTWDGTKWVAAGTGTGVYLPLTGGTMTGDITLKGDPSAALHPVTKQMFDNQANITHGNRLINGDFKVDQRTLGSAGDMPSSSLAFPADRWLCNSVGPTGKILFSRVVAGPSTTASGIAYYLACKSAGAYTPLATETNAISQIIEADMINDFAFGTANAVPLTLSFWCNTNVPGTYSGSVCNADGSRTYPFTFTVGNGDMTRVIVNIPGDKAGTWTLAGNGKGMIVRFDLGSGANFRAPAGAWTTVNAVGANGAIIHSATANALLNITKIKLEIGSIATPFEVQSVAKRMADCQRYFQYSYFQVFTMNGAAGNGFNSSYFLPVFMRAAPTAVFLGMNYTNASGVNAPGLTPSGAVLSATLTVAGFGAATGYVQLLAEL